MKITFIYDYKSNETWSNPPADEIYCIIHPKTIERQERQNNYYDTL
jgi:hypothetical protein